MPQAPQSLTTLIRQGAGSSLLEESLRQIALKKLLSELLPLHLRDHLEGCALRKGILTIEWSSPAAANLARFQSPALIEQLRDRGVRDLRDTRMRSRPPTALAPIRKPPAQLPSESVIEQISSLAAHMETSELKDALLQLSTTLQKKRRRP